MIVAVAANMQYAMEDLSIVFEKKYGIKVEISSASSGVLTTQIKQGAPFDLFISANMRYPNLLFQENLTVDTPEVYAHGSLVLWTMKGVDISKGLACLLEDNVKKIAIANNETAPYGIAAFEALKNKGYLDSISSKLIYGESVGQVNQYIMSKSVDIGLTSKSVLFSPKIKGKGHYIEIDTSLYKPIYQGIVMLMNAKEKNLKNAELFYNFMFSVEAKEVLTKYGYEIK